jgi:hypothetical protein
MQTIRLVDALAVRIVSSSDCLVMDATLERLGREMAAVEAHLAPNNVHGLKHQVEILQSQMQARRSCCRECFCIARLSWPTALWRPTVLSPSLHCHSLWPGDTC